MCRRVLPDFPSAAPEMTSTQLYLRLLGYVKPYWGTFALSLLGMAITAATEPLLPALLKPLIDGTFVHKDESVIRLAPLFILGIFLLRGFASFLGTYAINWVGNKVVMDLRAAIPSSSSGCWDGCFI
jgi:subfamily B ATP-binding cassette protein MsbA